MCDITTLSSLPKYIFVANILPKHKFSHMYKYNLQHIKYVQQFMMSMNGLAHLYTTQNDELGVTYYIMFYLRYYDYKNMFPDSRKYCTLISNIFSKETSSNYMADGRTLSTLTFRVPQVLYVFFRQNFLGIFY